MEKEEKLANNNINSSSTDYYYKRSTTELSTIHIFRHLIRQEFCKVCPLLSHFSGENTET